MSFIKLEGLFLLILLWILCPPFGLFVWQMKVVVPKMGMVYDICKAVSKVTKISADKVKSMYCYL